jgi:diacylglycerol kinase (ATP)
MKPGKRGLPRLIDATRYSMQGLRAAWRNEEAFRIEASLALIAVPLAFWVGDGLAHQLLLVIVSGIVIITELLNSAIEAAIDRFGGEIHPLSARAKDIGSAAVFCSLLLFAATWGASLLQHLDLFNPLRAAS